MILELYSVFDDKLGAYLAPFCSANHSTAVRQFESAVGDETHDFHRHASDYSLWHVGTFDSEKGQIIHKPMSVVAHAHEILANLERITQ